MSQGNPSQTGGDEVVAINGQALKTIRSLLRIKRQAFAEDAQISIHYLIKLENSKTPRNVTASVYAGLHSNLPGVPRQAILAYPAVDVAA